MFLELTKPWKGYESAALEFLYLNYIMNEKEQRQRKS